MLFTYFMSSWSCLLKIADHPDIDKFLKNCLLYIPTLPTLKIKVVQLISGQILKFLQNFPFKVENLLFGIKNNKTLLSCHMRYKQLC
jgi:hypothetical protein